MFKVGDVVALKDDPFQKQYIIYWLEDGLAYFHDEVSQWQPLLEEELELWTVED